jgi:transposase-like protein
MSYIKRNSNVDGYCWYCNQCRAYSTLRKDSVFENCRLNGKTILKIMAKYINNYEYVQIAYDLNTTRQTVSDYCELFREAVFYSYETNRELIGGVDENGSGKIVEIDESLFFKRKYNRGRIINGQWYIGGIERGSRKSFIVPVSNRNTETIMRVITENIIPGTKIITDQWRAYNSAFQRMPEYEHASVNHSISFINPNDPIVHTQNIEGLWSRSKYFLRKKTRISREEQSRYLIEFLWRYSTPKEKRINELIKLLRFE